MDVYTLCLAQSTWKIIAHLYYFNELKNYQDAPIKKVIKIHYTKMSMLCVLDNYTLKYDCVHHFDVDVEVGTCVPCRKKSDASTRSASTVAQRLI